MAKRQSSVEFWRAENHLISEAVLGYYYVSKRNTFILCVNYPKKISGQIVQVIEIAKSDLEQQFATNLKALSSFHKAITKIAEAARESNFYTEAKDVFTSVVAKLLAQMSKPFTFLGSS